MRRRAGRRPPVRGWMFWRTAFWTRPAFVLLAAVVLVVSVPFIARDGWHGVRNQRLLDDGVWCGQGRTPCVREVRGTLSGPYSSRRDPGQSWLFSVDGAEQDEFDLDGGWESTVETLEDDATVLTVDGDVVAVVAPDGYIAVRGLGWRGAATSMFLALFCLGMAIAGLSYARRKAAAHGSWWTIDQPTVSPAPPWAALLMLPGGVGTICGLLFPWWQVPVAAFAIASVVVVMYVPRWARLRSSGRHRFPDSDELRA